MLHKHSFKKYFIPSILFLVGCVIGYFLLSLINNTFQIQKVEVSGVNQQERKTFTILLKGLSTLTTQSSEINNIIHMRFPTIKIKSSSIQFPSTLVLVIEKEKPFAYLSTDFGYLALSKNGMVVMKERSPDIPYPSIFFYQTVHHSEYQIGQYIGFTAVGKALTFIALLASEGYQTETVAIDSVDMIACKTKGFEVAFSQSRPVELQSHEAQQIFRQIRVGVLQVERIDLRFDKPVVKLLQK